MREGAGALILPSRRLLFLPDLSPVNLFPFTYLTVHYNSNGFETVRTDSTKLVASDPQRHGGYTQRRAVNTSMWALGSGCCFVLPIPSLDSIRVILSRRVSGCIVNSYRRSRSDQ